MFPFDNPPAVAGLLRACSPLTTMSRVGRAAVDWIRIASRVPASEKAALAAFRAKHETLQAA